jgi:hypothetical protein
VQRHGHRLLLVGVGAEALQEAALEQQGELQVGKQHLKSRGCGKGQTHKIAHLSHRDPCYLIHLSNWRQWHDQATGKSQNGPELVIHVL